ncbi:hypothetical protein DL93DRAFT_2053035 [Clavulina sp. PMI_390]|nr:hypothetical protein DL93DRAFT_2053035 [Clavulina sp. PMI_390]
METIDYSEARSTRLEHTSDHDFTPGPSTPRREIRAETPTKRALTPPPLLNFLKDTSVTKPTAKPALPLLLLTTPEAISKYTPTTFHPSILPPELATQLYYELIDISKSWPKYKWYLNDRMVESTHTASYFARYESDTKEQERDLANRHWWQGKMMGPSKQFTPLLETTLQHIEKFVRGEVAKRRRYPLEWAGDWTANSCAVNCYRGSKEGVGAHADQLTYLGPYPTIASISLGTTRRFRLREVIPIHERETRQAQTFDIPLPHNSLLIMHPPTQERFKHSIPTATSIDAFRPPFPREPGDDIETHVERINITFRFCRPDFKAASTPKCKCEGGGKLPALLRSSMKRKKTSGLDDAEFFWQCNGAASQEGRSCKMWIPMDLEDRGPFVKDVRK